MSSSSSSSPRFSRRVMNRTLLLGALTAASSGALLTCARESWAAGWKEIKDSHGIKVFKKDVSSKLHEFRGVGLVDAPMEKVIWVLADNDHRTDWVDRLKKSVILERKSKYDFVVYQHFGSPPVISDRDFVYRARAYSKDKNTAILDIKSVTHAKAPKTVGVRGELVYYVLKRAGNKTIVDVSVSLDPKGALPGWVVNLVQKSWPLKNRHRGPQ